LLMRAYWMNSERKVFSNNWKPGANESGTANSFAPLGKTIYVHPRCFPDSKA
jgi:hypothetical protein